MNNECFVVKFNHINIIQQIKIVNANGSVELIIFSK